MNTLKDISLREEDVEFSGKIDICGFSGNLEKIQL
jgi:hypothetical protein